MQMTNGAHDFQHVCKPKHKLSNEHKLCNCHFSSSISNISSSLKREYDNGFFRVIMQIALVFEVWFSQGNGATYLKCDEMKSV